MPHKKSEYFTSRSGLILSLIGTAIGAGNIWRFARVVAQNGGGSFIIPWAIFLFVWSIPLIIAEIAIGKKTRRAPIGALAQTAGPKFGWMGAFIALVTTGILFYYSIVVGWGFRYFVYSVTGKLTSSFAHKDVWEGFTHSFQPFYFHIAAVSLGCFIIYKGIVKGVERSNKILIPALLIMILIIAIRAITLPNAWQGIEFLFTPHLHDLFNYKIWLEALTQNAWDTGAGWGMMLVYAGYAHTRSSIVVNGALAAFANNAVSLLMGIIIFSTVFALEHAFGIQELINGTGSTNTGLTFIYLPRLFQELPGGGVVQSIFATLFFLAFSFAALSSMISMIQVTSQTICELGLSRNKAITTTFVLAIVIGAPSALSMAFFDNQDWVWSSGLIVSGLFIAFAALRYGVNRFRTQLVNTSPRDFKLGKFYNILIGVLIPAQAIILIIWGFYQGIAHVEEGTSWYSIFSTFSVGTVLFQWGIGLIIFWIFNNWMVKRSLEPHYFEGVERKKK